MLSVIFWKFVPALFFTLYMIYGLARPWVSKRWRKEIEDLTPEDIEDEAELTLLDSDATGAENEADRDSRRDANS